MEVFELSQSDLPQGTVKEREQGRTTESPHPCETPDGINLGGHKLVLIE